jgi:hypothetical protein
MTIEEYVSGLAGWQAQAVQTLVELVVKAVPEAKGSIKWSQPVFELGGPFCFIKPAKKHINFGFWWGARMEDPEGLLQGSGAKMRHVKISGPEDIDQDKFSALARQSAELNRKLGDPTRTKA